MSITNLGARDLQWRKARRSAGNGACVEVDHLTDRILSVTQRMPMGPFSDSCPPSFTGI